MINQHLSQSSKDLIHQLVVCNMKGMKVGHYRTTAMVTRDVSPGKHAVFIDSNKCPKSFVLYVSKDGLVELERTA